MGAQPRIIQEQQALLRGFVEKVVYERAVEKEWSSDRFGGKRSKSSTRVDWSLEVEAALPDGGAFI